MPNLKLKLDHETFDALQHRAQSERRPVDWQAEVILRQSLGLPFPYERGLLQAISQQNAMSISSKDKEANNENN